MTKKTRLIPFDYNLWKDGAIPIRRNGDEIVFIVVDALGIVCVSLNKYHRYDFHRLQTRIL